MLSCLRKYVCKIVKISPIERAISSLSWDDSWYWWHMYLVVLWESFPLWNYFKKNFIHARFEYYETLDLKKRRFFLKISNLRQVWLKLTHSFLKDTYRIFLCSWKNKSVAFWNKTPSHCNVCKFHTQEEFWLIFHQFKCLSNSKAYISSARIPSKIFAID